MKKLITRGLIFGAGFGLARTIYREDSLIKTKENIVNGVSKLLFGADAKTYYETKSLRERARYYTNYAKYAPRRRYNFAEDEQAHRSSIKNYTFTKEEDAETVLDKMKDCLFNFGYASIGDLIDNINDVTNAHLTAGWNDYEYGWKDISSAKIYHVMRSGYVIMWPFESHVTEMEDSDEEEEE